MTALLTGSYTAAVRKAVCPLCIRRPGVACTVQGRDHLARHQQAANDGFITRGDLNITYDGLPLIAAHVVIRPAVALRAAAC
jgi:hypothetical protein